MTEKSSGQAGLRAGNGGWVRFDHPELPGPLYVRLGRESDGRWETREVYLDGRGKAITGEMLRTLPVAAVEGFVNSDMKFGASLADRLGQPRILVSELASHFAPATYGPKVTHWLADMIRSQFPNSGVPTVPRRADPKLDGIHPEVPPLRAPTNGLTDDFLRSVAAAYSALVIQGNRRPAVTLAEQAVVKDRTVHDWIYLARKRGFLEPGRKGKVG